MKMESVLQTEDDGQLWDTLVATELVECSNQENLGSVEEVLKAVPVTESVLFQVQVGLFASNFKSWKKKVKRENIMKESGKRKKEKIYCERKLCNSRIPME